MGLYPISHGVRKMFNNSPVKMVIDGERVPSLSGETGSDFNPSTGEKLAEVYSADGGDVNRAVEASQHALKGKWGAMLPDEREAVLRRFAHAVEKHAEELAQLESLENGKPLNHTLSIDAPAAASNLYHFASWPSRIFGQTVPVSLPDMFVYTRLEPVGVVAIIIPWNYPLIHATQKIGPALAAGNAVILKPASATPVTAVRLAELGLEAGLPPGALNVITGRGSVIGKALSSHPGINRIQVTGSTEVGQEVIRNSAVNIKRLGLELGSKAPNCIFADADLEKAIPGSFRAAFGNTGQSCVAGSRLYVQAPVYDAVVEGLLNMAGKARVGHAFDPETELGPIVDEWQFQTIMDYIESGKQSGAKLLCGGEQLLPPAVPEGGFYLPPTIFTEVADDAVIVKEEIFGPVLTVQRFETEKEFITRANDTVYGLASGVWTQNLARAHRVAGKLQTGVVWVNTYDMFSGNAPFGGFKQSGYGRDNGFEAIQAVTETKAVWMPVS